MPFLEISVIPVGTNTPSFSSHVSRAVQRVKDSGLKYQITPTSTIIEGETDELFDLAKDIHAHSMSRDCQRVITHMTFEDRTDKFLDMGQQVDVIHQSLQ